MSSVSNASFSASIIEISTYNATYRRFFHKIAQIHISKANDKNLRFKSPNVNAIITFCPFRVSRRLLFFHLNASTENFLNKTRHFFPAKIDEKRIIRKRALIVRSSYLKSIRRKLRYNYDASFAFGSFVTWDFPFVDAGLKRAFSMGFPGVIEKYIRTFASYEIAK